MPARERERGELPSPDLSLLGRKVRQGLIVSTSAPALLHLRFVRVLVLLLVPDTAATSDDNPKGMAAANPG